MRLRLTPSKAAGIITILGTFVLCQAQNPAAPGRSKPLPPPVAPSGPLDPRVDQILTRLENRQIDDLHAKVSWKLRYVLDLEEDAITKNGEIWYQQQKPVAKFLVSFNNRVSGGRLHKLDERHMFDGRWYIEENSETKTFDKREVRRADDPGDPYRLGEGPFPVPFGQKKADILRQFEVTLGQPGANDPPNTDRLHLVPRPGSDSYAKYAVVDVWVAREGPESGLPVKVEATKKRGTGEVDSFITIEFKEAELNRGFSGSIFKLEPKPGYEVYEERLEPAAPPK
ncbi:MAG TPA: hypothetical protein P5255_03985 [Phycisphaerae bacterium]|nr:hypothetical protein [Phycisphaerae bacterium]